MSRNKEAFLRDLLPRARQARGIPGPSGHTPSQQTGGRTAGAGVCRGGWEPQLQRFGGDSGGGRRCWGSAETGRSGALTLPDTCFPAPPDAPEMGGPGLAPGVSDGRQGKSGCCHQERGSRRTRRLSPDSGPPSRSVSRGCGPEGPSRASLRTSLRAQTSVSSRPPSDAGLQPGRRTGGPGAQSDLDRADPDVGSDAGQQPGKMPDQSRAGNFTWEWRKAMPKP